MIMALNVGYYNTKVKTSRVKKIHPTKIQENENGARTLTIDYSYEIGVGARDISDKQLNRVHEICTKYNILKHSNGEDICLIVALPMSLYLNKDYREKYRMSLLGNHKGIVDGESKIAYVKECTVIAEGAAAYLPYKSIMQDKVVGILDFGGNTINCLIYDCGNILRDTISTLDLGMIKLERKIIDAVNTAKTWNMQEYEVKELIESGECKEIVDVCIEEHLKEVKQRLLEKKWNIDRLTIFATGGGSIQLKKYLEGIFKVVVSQNGLWDNVDGLYLVGEVIANEKNNKCYK